MVGSCGTDWHEIPTRQKKWYSDLPPSSDTWNLFLLSASPALQSQLSTQSRVLAPNYRSISMRTKFVDYFHIRALQHIRRSLSDDIANSVACDIVGARLDYCNTVLHGISDNNISKLQDIQNTLAWVVTGTKKREHITLVLQKLYWLPILHSIRFEIFVIMSKIIQMGLPEYLPV